MKLYKIENVLGHRGISVFAPDVDPGLVEAGMHDVPLAVVLARYGEKIFPPHELPAEPIARMIKTIVAKGYTKHEAFLAIEAWARHARMDLNQGAVGVRVYCEKCAAEIPLKQYPAQPVVWGVILAVAVIAAVALALYVWVVLDQEFNVPFGTHEWAYLMTYQEHLWQGEILNVGSKQEAYYELGGDFGLSIDRIDRNVGAEPRRDWIELKTTHVFLEGRHPILYHVYRFTGFRCYFCGVMTKVGTRLYRLREGGSDPYKPTGPWSRPGTRWGTPNYDGCWKRWWWF